LSKTPAGFLPIPKSSYFYNKYYGMKFRKLTALSFIAALFIFPACDADDIFNENLYLGNSLPMSGAQEVPAVATSATGTINASYNKLSRILTYSVAFSGLSGNAAAAHIHGTAEAGYNANVLQSFSGFPAATSGSYSGTLYFDGVKLLEEHLLAGRYYVNIHTPARPGGEIRGQLILTRQ
jgi:hypothetical protein